jgi:hypothetical protein
MEYEEIPKDPEMTKQLLKVRRELVQKVLGEIGMLSEVLKQQLGPVAYVQYMQEVGLSAQGDMFGPPPNRPDTKAYSTPQEYYENDPEWRAYLAKGKKPE